MTSSTLVRSPRHALASTFAIAALLTLAAPAHAARPAVLIEESWSSPELDKHPVRTVAVLPAVTLDSYAPNHPLSDSLAAGFQGDGRRWIPPLAAWTGLGDSEIARLAEFRKMADEVRSSGRAKPATTARLARLLAADAIMFVRIDRWERIPDATEVTTVEARTELVHADGTPLWRVAGKSRVYTASYRPRTEMPKPSTGNKLLEVQVIGAPSGGSSGGNSSTSGGGGSGGSSQSSSGQASNAPRVQKVERQDTPLEDIVRTRDRGQPEASMDPFVKASAQMVSAWAARRPAGFAGAAAPKGATSEGAGTK
jgi:hypothetical protein